MVWLTLLSPVGKHKPICLLYLQTEPLKLYYVMYDTSKPSAMKSSDEEIVSCREYFHQRRENYDVTDKAVEEECAKRSVNMNWQQDDTGNITTNQQVSAFDSDVADVNCNVGLLSIAKPGCLNELYSEKSVTEGTDEVIGDVKDDALEYKAADAERLSVVSSGMEKQCTSPAKASSEAANDSGTGTVANNGDIGAVVCRDGVTQNDEAVSPPELVSEEKIGFEPDAITAADQWPPRLPVVERRVKRLKSEVQRLLFDENGSGRKRELRASGRSLGGLRRKTRRSPLQRLRSIVSLRPSTSNHHSNKLSGRVDSKGN